MTSKWIRVTAGLLAISISFIAAACGNSSAGTSATPAAGLAPAACLSATAGASAEARQSRVGEARAAVGAVPLTTLPPGLTIGRVAVEVESGGSTSGSTIFAWAGNGLNQCIYTTDHHSDCSIVTLERQVNGTWQPQANCQQASPRQTVVLLPVQSMFVRLTPGSATEQPGAWATGIYRVAFSYSLDQRRMGLPLVVYSQTFTVA